MIHFQIILEIAAFNGPELGGGQRFVKFVTSGVTISPADPTLQGAPFWEGGCAKILPKQPPTDKKVIKGVKSPT